MNKKELAEQIAKANIKNWNIWRKEKRSEVIAAIIEAMSLKPENGEEEEKFFAKIFPQEDNDPIFPDADLARWVNKYQPPKRTDGLSQNELTELQLKHSCSMLRELLEKKLSEEQKLEENTRNCGEYSKKEEHYENMVAIQRVMTLI